MALPEMTPEQRQEALAKAAKVRSERAELCKELKSGKITLASVLKKAGDPMVDKTKVTKLVESLPGYGKAKAAKLLEEIGIDSSRRVKGLGEKQKAALLEKLA
ncbi:MAG: integration host factor [Coriobacteriales bacterium]|nr:integration host factor [Coriobacteriales bacterium]